MSAEAKRVLAEYGRNDPVNSLAMVLFEAWCKADPSSGPAQHPASYLANFADMARAALSPSPAVRDGVVLVALNADGEERATIRFEDDPWPIAEFIEWMKGWQESDPSRVVTARALSTQEQGNG